MHCHDETRLCAIVFLFQLPGLCREKPSRNLLWILVWVPLRERLRFEAGQIGDQFDINRILPTQLVNGTLAIQVMTA
ncbi:hypothetical protein GALL_531130 [mine drainage metagenome]|uniref:Uncharacterized protein n=1 Tax=mine drainage metagenome TaxID=410659 RepID=A0A1J5P1C3_9ZZZZ